MTELNNEENFLPADRQDDSNKRVIAPSERLIPAPLAAVEPINNLMTRDWKENGIDASNSTMH